LIGGYISYAGAVAIPHLLIPHFCDFPENGCSSWTYPIFAVGVGMLAATGYAFLINHKKTSRKIDGLHP
jgi:hypothetical protein